MHITSSFETIVILYLLLVKKSINNYEKLSFSPDRTNII
jgi:hypothetical protein